MNDYMIKNLDNQKNVNLTGGEEKDIDIIVDLSSDYYEAYITILSSKDEVSVSKDFLLEELRKKNISYGIKYDVIDRIVQNPEDVYRISIAFGKRHENGKDGRIECCFNTSCDKTPKVLSDGKVNHKELNYVNQVRKGDILAKKILPVPSNDGKTVTNRVIKAKAGKYIDFKKGKNVMTSDDGMLLLAAVDGQVKFQDGKISVIKVLEIDQDVGVATGNIRFDGKIIVNGNVGTGYKIQSKEDVEIRGIVEGAEIEALNIIILKGVHNKSKLTANGNITATFMENCYAEAKGDIISDTIIHCDIKCYGKIIATQKKGLILGGSICARRGIVTKSIGSQIGSITKIQLGIDEELVSNIKNTKTKIEESKSCLKKINKSIDILKIKKSKDYKKDILLDKYFKTRAQYRKEIKILEGKMKELFLIAENLKNSSISSNHIYPGTNIKINNTYYTVKKALTNVTLISENGEIVISPNFKRS